MSPPFEERLTESLFQARAGDKRALEWLISHTRKWVLQLVKRLLSPRPGTKLDAEDIAQDVLMKVWVQFDSFKGETSSQLLAWISRLVRHAVLDSSRLSKAQKRDAHCDVRSRRMMLRVTGDSSGPEQEIAQREWLQQATQQLSERQRVVVALRMEGRTFAEVAEHLGITRQGAGRTFAVAIRRLRDMMEELVLGRPRPPRSDSARPQSPLVSERTSSRPLSATSPEDEADESVRRLYFRLGLICTDASSTCEINWGEFEQLLFGPGDPDATNQALEEFRAYLETLTFIQIDPRLRSKFDLSDVIQNTLLTAWRDLERNHVLDADARKRWLRRRLVNNLLEEIDHWRAKQRDPHGEQSLDAAAAESSCRLQSWLAAEDASPSEQLAEQEEALRLLEALSKLDRRQREALILQKYHGQTLAQIAEQFGCTTGAVAGLHARGLMDLRKHLPAME
jgi:RNA polymerase sigma-70 factor (ECF subfamily)